MAVTGWKFPGTTANVDRDGKALWNNTDEAKVCDNTRTWSNVAATDYNDWLRLTNFGFGVGDIPANHSIDGIEVKNEHNSGTPNSIKDSAIYLRKTAGQVGDNKAKNVHWASGGADEEITYGGAADDWNAGLAQADIIHANFGIDISAVNDDGFARTCSIDCVSIRVHHTLIPIELSASDGFVLGDAPGAQVTFNPAITDGLVFGDTPSTQCSFGVVASDGLVLGDAPAISLTINVAVTDGIVFGEALVEISIAGVPPLGYILELRDSSDDLVAILENAYDIVYEQGTNQAPTLFFRIPTDDAKADDITSAHWIWLRSYPDNTLIEKFRLNKREDTRT